jgi:hypothetical protein
MVKKFINKEQFKFTKIKYFEYIFNKKIFLLFLIFLYFVLKDNKGFIGNFIIAGIFIFIIFSYLNNPNQKNNLLNLKNNPNLYYSFINKVKQFAYKRKKYEND